MGAEGGKEKYSRKKNKGKNIIKNLTKGIKEIDIEKKIRLRK